MGTYSPWSPASQSDTDRAKPKVFVKGVDDEIYLYSAIANYHQPYNGEVNIIVTSLDASTASLKCCVLLDNATLYITPATEYFYYHTVDVKVVSWVIEYFHQDVNYAHQHACTVPHTGHVPSQVTLTSKSCSRHPEDYLPVIFPPQVPGGLAICAKIAHSGGLDPEKFVEWMEVQRIMGVDKVLIYDLGNPASLMRVFKYYQDLGLLGKIDDT